MIYLDNASTTMIAPEVLDAMMPYLTYEYGNPGTLYDLGFSAKKAVEKAREQVAEFMGAESPEHIIFTSGGTESNNMVFNSYRISEEQRCKEENADKKGIVVSAIEHDSVLRAAGALTKSGFHVNHIGVHEDGRVYTAELDSLLASEATGLASIMYVNNEVVSVNDIRKLAEVCHKHYCLLHSDCVQAAGCFGIQAKELGCDYMSISSHKIHGPKGVGALYVRDVEHIYPMISGGASQEHGLRGGTENVAGIVGLGAACEFYNQGQAGQIETRLKRVFWSELHKRHYKELCNGRVRPMHDNAMSSLSQGKTLSVRFDGVDAEALVLLLGSRGVCISAGSACSSHEQHPSHVLLGIGLTEAEARSTVRFSFSRTNTENDVLAAARVVVESVQDLLSGGAGN